MAGEEVPSSAAALLRAERQAQRSALQTALARTIAQTIASSSAGGGAGEDGDGSSGSEDPDSNSELLDDADAAAAAILDADEGDLDDEDEELDATGGDSEMRSSELVTDDGDVEVSTSGAVSEDAVDNVPPQVVARRSFLENLLARAAAMAAAAAAGVHGAGGVGGGGRGDGSGSNGNNEGGGGTPQLLAMPPGLSSVEQMRGLAYATDASTAGTHLRQRCILPVLESGYDAKTGAAQDGRCKGSSASSSADCCSSTPASTADSVRVISTAHLLRRREAGLGPSGGGFTTPEMRHMQCHRHFPVNVTRQVDYMDSRAYIGRFSGDGSLFIAAFQDRRVRVYNVERDWSLRKDVTTQLARWTITDTCMSPDQRFLVYSSIAPTVHVVRIGSAYDSLVDSRANVTEAHDALNFYPPNAEADFGIWSIRWSQDGREIIAGSNDNSVYVYNVERQKVTARVEGHRDDVNAVAYADDSPNVILSGSDDCLIKVWDRRTLDGGGLTRFTTPQNRPAAVGVLSGHTEGITHLDPRGDGRHLISNCKDQSIKLWDLRTMVEENAHSKWVRENKPKVPTYTHWDYRRHAWPGDIKRDVHPNDKSLMTYRGHVVLQSLIRAYFSPAHSTGQRYIYSGSQDGTIHVWDVVTGALVKRMKHHKHLVRDVSWHPWQPVMVSVSWEGNVIKWDCAPTDDKAALAAMEDGVWGESALRSGSRRNW